jgi:tetratricopeptide (TPR) repeat protein
MTAVKQFASRMKIQRDCEDCQYITERELRKLEDLGDAATACGRSHRVSEQTESQRAVVLGDVGWFCSLALGRHHAALQLLEEASSIERRFLKEDDYKLLGRMVNLETIYHRIGRLHKAEELLTQTLWKQFRVLGAEHPNTLTTTHYLASAICDQGQLKKAKELDLQVIEAGKGC